ncbi:MAG: TolC family protein [Elusimicrobia bacterium]|nr:TolC family protein [Elusimicrobiota bacterium]
MSRFSAVLLAAFLFPAAAAADAPVFTLSMADAEAAARAHSLEDKAAAEDSAAARSRADASFAPLLPRLTLDGYYRYQTEVPRFSVVPGQPPQPFGSNRATSIGPTLNWTLWDEGALRKTWRAQAAGARSQEEQERLTQTQVTQALRLSYVQVQLAREKVRLLADSVTVADAQYADIQKRVRAGAASRIDSLSSHQVDLQRRKDFLSAQSELAAALRELFQLTGLGAGLDLTRPVDVRVSTSLPAGLPQPTVRVVFDSLADTPAALAAAEAAAGPSSSHPRALAWARQAEAARLSADAEAAARGPKVQLSGAIAYQYPNGPVLQSVTQKSVGLTASMPLFEGRQSARRAEAQRRAAAADDRRRDLVVEQLSRDWDKAREALAALRDQAALDTTAVGESDELARLSYLSYLGGRSTYIEVQTYELAALQAKVNAAQTRAQILIQLAALAQLAAQG